MLKGVVVHGDKIASGTFRMPTANIDIAPLSYDSGSYWCIICVRNQQKYATVYVSPNRLNVIECHIHEWDDDLYGESIQIERIEKLRDHANGESFDQLLTWMRLDHLAAKIMSNLHMALHGSKSIAISFSGGKEASLCYFLLSVLGLPFHPIHYVPRHETVFDFVTKHNCKIIEYDSMKTAVNRLDDYYDAVVLGVRREDLPQRPKVYQSTWLEKCRVITPLFDCTYKDIWNLICHLNVDTNPLYAQGYSSVGYNSKPNKLLIRFPNGFIHAKYLENTDFERM